MLFAVLLFCVVRPAHAVSNEAILAKSPPKLLSEFGFFEDARAQKPAEGVIPFDLSTPLFSDGALKYRFVHVPKGKSAAFHESEAFDFPEGTALIKTFAFAADQRAPDKAIRLIETRVLLRQADGWQAWAYLWNEEQTDAVLKIAGAKVNIATIAADGEPLAFTYAVPNKNQCKACHAFNDEIVPLGPKARNLNHNFPYDGGNENQIAHWAAAGMLSGAPAPEAAPTVPDWRDAGASLDARARTWLDVNCAHCHRKEGPASNSGLWLTYGEKDPVKIGVRKRPVAAGKGSGGRQFDILPGDPDGSILPYRVESTEPGVMMPELGRHIGDPDAVALLREWIAAMR
ncbi:SO2930 family diheme c-type cytochrome [Mesorhizobium sp. 1B3]|uniref:SO2930 family diheme c-type cytochrome n=1 Tax=Mesorhizobium sp. 1B3 TaxID=3243599 RepID=UPI003D981E5B